MIAVSEIARIRAKANTDRTSTGDFSLFDIICLLNVVNDRSIRNIIRLSYIVHLRAKKELVGHEHVHRSTHHLGTDLVELGLAVAHQRQLEHRDAVYDEPYEKGQV